MCKPELNKEGICINKKCKGCSYYFMEDLKKAGFKGIFINEKGAIINF